MVLYLISALFSAIVWVIGVELSLGVNETFNDVNVVGAPFTSMSLYLEPLERTDT